MGGDVLRGRSRREPAAGDGVCPPSVRARDVCLPDIEIACAGLRTWSEHAGVSVKQRLARRTSHKPSARRNDMAPSDAALSAALNGNFRDSLASMKQCLSTAAAAADASGGAGVAPPI
eukprot:1189750-Prymnesium_polylepis.1